MKNIVDEMFEKKDWVVLGANINPNKFGNKIYKKLANCDYNVTPVNPVYDEVEGVKCFNSISEVDANIECVNVVVSPKRSLPALDEIKAKGIEYVWFQPGTYNDEVIEKANSLGLKIVYGYCVLVEMGDLPFCPL